MDLSAIMDDMVMLVRELRSNTALGPDLDQSKIEPIAATRRLRIRTFPWANRATPWELGSTV